MNLPSSAKPIFLGNKLGECRLSGPFLFAILTLAMRILLAMLMLALIAVLWATVAIGRHIYKSRRRAQILRERRPQSWADSIPTPLALPPAGHSGPAAAELSFAEVSMKSFSPQQTVIPANFEIPVKTTPASSQPSVPAPAPIPSAGRAVAPQSNAAGTLGLIAAARKLSQEMPLPQMRRSGSRPAFDPPTLARQTPSEPLQPLPIPSPEIFAQLPEIGSLVPTQQPVPSAESSATAFTKLASGSIDLPPRKQPQPAESIATPSPESSTVQSDPFLRRPVRSVHPPQAAPSFVLPLRRPDWAYFNKDMGDLSDPAPSRIRDRVRSR